MEGTVENVFKDFTGRRAALITALTTELDEFYSRCDPNEVNLYLFAYHDETWEVRPPLEEVPPQIPEPALGINFARDDMDMKDWLEYIAAQSDAWLLSLAFFFGEKFQFDKKTRKRLFQMVNGLPTISEIITGAENKQTRAKTRRRRRKNYHSWIPKPRRRHKRKSTTLALLEKDEDSEEEGDEEEEEEGAVDEYPDDFCGACGDKKGNDEISICCDVCSRWFHVQCVSVCPSTAERIKHYYCPLCCNEQGSP